MKKAERTMKVAKQPVYLASQVDTGLQCLVVTEDPKPLEYFDIAMAKEIDGDFAEYTAFKKVGYMYKNQIRINKGVPEGWKVGLASTLKQITRTGSKVCHKFKIDSDFTVICAHCGYKMIVMIIWDEKGEIEHPISGYEYFENVLNRMRRNHTVENIELFDELVEAVSYLY